MTNLRWSNFDGYVRDGSRVKLYFREGRIRRLVVLSRTTFLDMVRNARDSEQSTLSVAQKTCAILGKEQQ